MRSVCTRKRSLTTTLLLAAAILSAASSSGAGKPSGGGGLTDASLLFQTAGTNLTIYLANANGSAAAKVLSIQFGVVFRYTLSPLGGDLVFNHGAGITAKVNYTISSGQLTVNSTVPLPECWFPKYSPDGSRIACSRSDANGDGRLFTMNADGTGIQSIYVASGKSIASPDWHYSGDSIYFLENTAGHGTILKVDLDPFGLPASVSAVYSNASLDVDSIALAKNLDEIAFAGTSGTSSHIYTMDLSTSVSSQEVAGSFPSYSSDDSAIYFTATCGKEKIQRMNLSNGSITDIATGRIPEVRR
jgi:Tol biopolymer transport system component